MILGKELEESGLFYFTGRGELMTVKDAPQSGTVTMDGGRRPTSVAETESEFRTPKSRPGFDPQSYL